MLLFADVLEQSSFTAAARLHGISKQAVSERINRLELALGVRLLQRTTRSLRPTEVGKRYALACSQMARLMQQANEDMQSEQNEPVGTLTVAAPVLFGRSQLVPLLQACIERHPKLRIDLRLSDRIVNLVEEGIDVALRVSHQSEPGLSARRLGFAQSFFVASPQLLAEHAGLSDAEILRRAPAVTFREGEIWQLPEGAKVKPNSVANIDDLAAMTAAVVIGLGIARLPGVLCRPHFADGSLVALLKRAPATTFSVYAAYASKRQLAPKIRCFVDLLVERRLDLIDDVDPTDSL